MSYVDKVPVVTKIPFNPSQLKLKEVVEHGDRVAAAHYDNVPPHIFKIFMKINLINVDHEHKEVNRVNHRKKDVEIRGV